MSRSVTRNAFPARPSELTARWLTVALRAAGVLGGADVVTGWVAHDIGAGVGIMGEILRLELRYQSDAGPLPSVIAKFATANADNRAVAAGFAMYEREVRFYSDLAPLVGDVAPICYHTDFDPETNDMVILFEDLAGYRPGDQEAGISVDDAVLALRAVARLHAKTWGAHEDRRFAAWPRVNGPIYLNGFGAGVAAGLQPALATFASVIDDRVIAAADTFRDAIPVLHERMAEGAQALAHGDFRLDNFMFGTAPEHRPFVMLDFQAPIVTKPVHDVAYLLTQSTSTEHRRAHQDSLLDAYHRALVDEGVQGYSRQQCWDDYRLAALHCFEYAVVVAGTLDPSNDRGRRWITQMMGRSAQTIVDLDLLDLLT